MSTMIRVLGASELRGEEGQALQSVLQQPRRFALLVYLAVASREGPVQRDTVLGVFWPEKPQDKARNALGQALHYLRRSLGSRTILSEDDRLTVDGERLECDAVQFFRAVDEGRWADALHLFRGDLLPGFYDTGASAGLEHWLEDTRREVRQAASRSAWKLAEAAEEDGDPANAIIHARKACEWADGTETEVRRLMELMGRLGDRTGVIEAYEGLLARLSDYDATPHPATEAVFAEIREGWARDDAARPSSPPASAHEEPATEAESRGAARPPSEPRRGGRSWPSRLRPSWRTVGSGTLTVGLMVSFLALWAPTRATPPVPTKSLVVVDSWDEGDVGQIAPMVRDQVVAHLQNTATLEVTDDIAPESLAQKEGFRVRGRMIQMGEIYRAAVHLVDGRTGQTLASTHVERPANGSTDVLDEISTAIATFTRKEVGNALEARRLTEADVPDQALLLIDLAKADWALADSLHHKNAEEEAIATFLKADSTLAQVGEMAPDWDMPWVLRAEMALDWLWAEWNAPAGGEGAARSRAARGSMLASEALKRNPGEAGNYELRAQLNHWQWLFSQPDPTGSSADLMQWVVDDARQAVGMDPYRADSWKLLGMTFLSAGEWNDAYWALGRAANADTYLRSNTEIVANLFNAAWESGNRESARGWCGHLEKSNPGEWVTALCRLYLLADSDEPDLGLVDSLQASLETRPQWATIWRDQFQALSAVVQAGGPHPEAARQILENVGRPPADSDLAVLHAWAYLKLGDEATARRLLDAYVASSPGSNAWVWKSHRFEGLAP